MPGKTLSNQHLRVYLTGGFRLEIRGEPIQLPTRKTRSLLAYLILHPGAHSREKLATLFWGDSSDSAARGSLRRALTLLRKYIDDDLILADRETVQLNPSYPMWVDLRAFEQQAEGFLSGTTAQAEQFKILSYVGDLLEDYYDEWILPLRTHYQGQYVDLLLRGVEQARGQSEYALAIEYAQKVLKCDQANERAHQHLMFCYITLGERNKALEQYEACQRALLDELAVEPSQETQALHHWIKQYEAEPTSLAARITNLPIPISSFVGRGRELSKIKGMVENNRLVTLTGPGGSGKTRLAIHAATDLIDSYRNGVWWVELAPVTEAELVPFAVAKALGLEGRSTQPMTERLEKYLCNRNALIILDNCEHLIEACAHLAERLLTCCADLKVLATSREALCLPGEHVWLVPPLTLPETETISLLDLLLEYEGVRLFVERAKAVNPDFKPDDDNAILITQICQRLDGIPLAIELAAARARSLEVAQISAGLDNTYQMLSATNRTANLRHQSLQAAIDWSFDLLSEPERLLFCRLSIFSGGWRLDAAEAVCSGDGVELDEIAELLARLVDKSLVNLSPNGKRYSMLETMRQYGGEKLVQMQARNQIFERYLDHYLKMARTGDEKIRGPNQFTWLKWFEEEHDNLAKAIEESLDSFKKLTKGCELVCSLCWYWGTVGDTRSMIRWLETALPRSVDLGRTSTRAKVLFNAGFFSVLGFPFLGAEKAKILIEEGLSIWRELPQDSLLEQGQHLIALGYIQKCFFRDNNGFKKLSAGIDIFRKADNSWWHAWALNLSIMMMDESQDAQKIRKILKEENELWNKTGDQCTSANAILDLGLLEFEQGNLIEAQSHFHDSLQRFKKFGAKGYVFQILVFLGDVARGLKQYDQADAYYIRSMPLVEVIMWDAWRSRVYFGLGFVALSKNNVEHAQEYFHQALTVGQEYNMKVREVLCIAGYAALAVIQGELKLATLLFGAFYAQVARVESETYRKVMETVDQTEIENYLALCRSQFEKADFELTWIEGSSLSMGEVLSEILKVAA